MLEAVKPVLLEKVDIIGSQSLTGYPTCTQTKHVTPCHTPRPTTTNVSTLSIVHVAYMSIDQIKRSKQCPEFSKIMSLDQEFTDSCVHIRPE